MLWNAPRVILGISSEIVSIISPLFVNVSFSSLLLVFSFSYMIWLTRLTFLLTALYEKGFGLNRAPGTLEKALDAYEIDQKLSKFGFAKDRVAVKSEPTSDPSPQSGGNVYQPEPVQSNTSTSHGSKYNLPVKKLAVTNTYNRRHSTGNVIPPILPKSKQENLQGDASSIQPALSNSQDKSSSTQMPQTGHNLSTPSTSNPIGQVQNKYTSRAVPNLARFAAGTDSGSQSNSSTSSSCTPMNSAHVLQESTNSQTRQVKRPPHAAIPVPESKKPSLPSSTPQQTRKNPYGKSSGYWSWTHHLCWRFWTDLCDSCLAIKSTLRELLITMVRQNMM